MKDHTEMTLMDCLLTEKQLRGFAREIETLAKRKKSSFFKTYRGRRYMKNCLVQIPECSYIGYPTVNLILKDETTIECQIYYFDKHVEKFSFNKEKADQIYIMLAEAYDNIEKYYLQAIERIGA